MAKASENIFPKVQFSEETAPATPSAGQAVVYVKADGKLYLKDDAGTETDLTSAGGAGSDTDAIHDNVAAEISALTLVTAASGDHVLIEDASDSNNKKRVAASDFLGSGAAIPEWLSYLVERQGDETSHADDDFFDDGATTGWTLVEPSGTNTLTEGRDRMSIMTYNNTNAQVIGACKSMTPSTSPVTIETRCNLMPAATAAQNGAFFVGFSDGLTTTSAIAGFYFYQTGGNLTAITQTGTFSASAYGTTYTVADDAFLNPYVRVIWESANTFSFTISGDGVSWTKQGSADISRTITPAYYVLGGHNPSASGPQAIASFDYLRVDTTDKSL